ncbi:glutaredoxin 2 isoform 2-T2 [Trichechus inunguis]
MSWRRAALVGTRLARNGSSLAGGLGGTAGAAASGMGSNTSSSWGKSAIAPMNQIQETISDNCVVIFSKTSCSYCTMAKKLFQDININYKVVELDMLEYGNQFQDALFKMTGERTHADHWVVQMVTHSTTIQKAGSSNPPRGTLEDRPGSKNICQWNFYWRCNGHS